MKTHFSNILREFALSAVWLACATTAMAGPRTSAAYSILTDTADSGGRRGTSASYTHDGSVGLIAGFSSVASPAVAVNHGYIGQITEDTAIDTAIVTSVANSGPGSLRDTLAAMPPGGTITFAPALSGQTILLTSGQLLVTKNLTIDGSTLPVSIDIQSSNDRIFQINAGAEVVLDSLTLSHANCPFAGGAILNLGGNLTLNRCTLADNTAWNDGGGGAIFNDVGATLTLNQCTLTGNHAQQQGGAIYNYTPATLTVIGCTISGNTSDGFPSFRGGLGGGGIFNAGTMNLSNTIVAGNADPHAPNISGPFNGNQNLTAGDPLLAPLGPYGGPTQTMPPLPGSSAIDAAGTTDPGGTDQRGFPRFVNGALDIGAVEVFFTVTTHTASTTSNSVDTWNNVASWTNGIPDGFMDAVIQTGKEAHAGKDAAGEPGLAVYHGNLTLESNSTLKIYGNLDASENFKALGTGTITMAGGSFLRFRQNHTHVISNPIVLTGHNAKIRAGESTAGLADLTFTGGITGAYDLLLEGNGGEVGLGSHIRLAAANTFASLTTIKWSNNSWDQDLVVHGNVAGSLGNGNITIADQISLEINAADAMSDSASLYLNGAKSAKVARKLVMNANDTVNKLFIDGVQQPAGSYDNTSLFLSGSGLLTVGELFDKWIDGFAVGALDGFGDDADGDGVKNGIENFFGTNPAASSTGLQATGKTGNTFTFTHPQNSEPALDITASYLWTKDLTNFHGHGAADGEGTTVTFITQLDTPNTGITTVTATVTGTAASKLFVVVQAAKAP